MNPKCIWLCMDYDNFLIFESIINSTYSMYYIIIFALLLVAELFISVLRINVTLLTNRMSGRLTLRSCFVGIGWHKRTMVFNLNAL